MVLSAAANNSALRAKWDGGPRIEAAVRDLNRELSRKIADFEMLLDVIPIGIAVADDPECRNIRANRALANMLGVPEGPIFPRAARMRRSRRIASRREWT